jgi:hypothetical protein
MGSKEGRGPQTVKTDKTPAAKSHYRYFSLDNDNSHCFLSF